MSITFLWVEIWTLVCSGLFCRDRRIQTKQFYRKPFAIVKSFDHYEKCHSRVVVVRASQFCVVCQSFGIPDVYLFFSTHLKSELPCFAATQQILGMFCFPEQCVTRIKIVTQASAVTRLKRRSQLDCLKVQWRSSKCDTAVSLTSSSVDVCLYIIQSHLAPSANYVCSTRLSRARKCTCHFLWKLIEIWFAVFKTGHKEPAQKDISADYTDRKLRGSEVLH